MPTRLTTMKGEKRKSSEQAPPSKEATQDLCCSVTRCWDLGHMAFYRQEKLGNVISNWATVCPANTRGSSIPKSRKGREISGTDDNACHEGTGDQKEDATVNSL